MITALTSFTLPAPISRDDARAIFLSTAPKYRDVPGLYRKTYVLYPDGVTVGGIYLWQTRAAAEAMYTNAWRDFVRGKYGCEPSVTYLDSPVVVDNVTRQTLTDE
jgi:4-amino-4-deoxy-L-arabinose transferase-like glycosyltransferase